MISSLTSHIGSYALNDARGACRKIRRRSSSPSICRGVGLLSDRSTPPTTTALMPTSSATSGSEENIALVFQNAQLTDDLLHAEVVAPTETGSEGVELRCL